MRQAATLSLAAARLEQHIISVPTDEDIAIDWRPYEGVLAEDIQSVLKAMTVINQTRDEVLFSFPDYILSEVPEQG